MLLLGAVRPVQAAAPEQQLADSLARIMTQHLGDGPVKLLPVAPPPETTPIPSDEALALARRVAGRAIDNLDAGKRITLLATDAGMAQSLAAVQRRRGRDGFRAKLKELAGKKADWALLSDIVPVDDGLRVRLRVMDLASGAIYGPTPSVTLDRPAREAGNARAALRAAAEELFLPKARTVGVRPFTYGTTDVAGPEGKYLASLLADAWLRAAERIVTGDPPAVEPLVGTSVDPPRYVVTGTMWRMSAQRVEVRVFVLDDGTVRASKRTILDTRSLPSDIAQALDPGRAGPTQGFAPIYRARIAEPGDAVLAMESPAGAAPVYEVCTDPAPETVRQCDTLRFKLRANRDGAAMCLSLGRDSSFGLLVPAAHYGAAVLRADRWRHLPSSLPKGPDGGRPVWYAQGEPGMSLVACYLFANREAVPRDALARLQGKRLDPRGVQRLRRILRAASPLAEAHAVVTIVGKET